MGSQINRQSQLPATPDSSSCILCNRLNPKGSRPEPGTRGLSWCSVTVFTSSPTARDLSIPLSLKQRFPSPVEGPSSISANLARHARSPRQISSRAILSIVAKPTISRSSCDFGFPAILQTRSLRARSHTRHRVARAPFHPFALCAFQK